jgi:ribosomal protein S18 acetylase RimI-like enzyme
MLIRPACLADAEVIAQVRNHTWRVTYRGLLSEAYLAALDDEKTAQHWREILSAQERQGFTFVAEAGGQVVGFCLAGEGRHDAPVAEGEIYALYVLPRFQGRGAGAALLACTVRRFLKQGMSSMRVWVLKGNPAEIFYQKMGAVFLCEQRFHVAGGIYPERAYRWRDFSRWGGAPDEKNW